MSCSISKWLCGRPARQNHRHQPTLPTLDSEATKDANMTHRSGLCCSRVHFPESRASPLQQQANPSLRTLCTTHCHTPVWTSLPTLDSEATKDGPMTHWNGLCCSRVHFPESRASPLQQQANPSPVWTGQVACWVHTGAWYISFSGHCPHLVERRA